MRPLLPGLGLACLTLAAAMAADAGRGQAPRTGPASPLTVACVAESPRAVLPESLCPLLIARLRAAYPDRAFAAGTPEAADLRLGVSVWTPGRVAARLNDGPERGAARRGGALSPAALARFLDRLIALTPLP